MTKHHFIPMRMTGHIQSTLAARCADKSTSYRVRMHSSHPAKIDIILNVFLIDNIVIRKHVIATHIPYITQTQAWVAGVFIQGYQPHFRWFNIKLMVCQWWKLCYFPYAEVPTAKKEWQQQQQKMVNAHGRWWLGTLLASLQTSRCARYWTILHRLHFFIYFFSMRNANHLNIFFTNFSTQSPCESSVRFFFLPCLPFNYVSATEYGNFAVVFLYSLCSVKLWWVWWWLGYLQKPIRK